MSLVEQELLTLPEHLSSPPVLVGFVLYVCFIDRCLYFCVVCSSLTDSDYPYGIFKLFLIRPTWMQWLYKVRLMRNTMNCLLFRIVFQRFFGLNRNPCFCAWDMLCLLVFLSIFFRSCFVFCFICFCLVSVALFDRFCVVFFFTFWFSYSLFSLNS